MFNKTSNLNLMHRFVSYFNGTTKDHELDMLASNRFKDHAPLPDYTSSNLKSFSDIEKKVFAIIIMNLPKPDIIDMFDEKNSKGETPLAQLLATEYIDITKKLPLAMLFIVGGASLSQALQSKEAVNGFKDILFMNATRSCEINDDILHYDIMSFIIAIEASVIMKKQRRKSNNLDHEGEELYKFVKHIKYEDAIFEVEIQALHRVYNSLIEKKENLNAITWVAGLRFHHRRYGTLNIAHFIANNAFFLFPDCYYSSYIIPKLAKHENFDLNAYSSYGLTALIMAIMSKNKSCINSLLEENVDVNTYIQLENLKATTFYFSVVHGDTELLSKFIVRGADVTSVAFLEDLELDLSGFVQLCFDYNIFSISVDVLQENLKLVISYMNSEASMIMDTAI